ncbi:MAG: DUF2808 domain-containing protein [Oscillatoriales cyanobacterium SM2_1_8]|nr:DUF2808 domain-containing protein [Oscillatoriales cyanobacterium SM2_1_8]
MTPTFPQMPFMHHKTTIFLAIALGLGLTGGVAPTLAQSNAGFIIFGKIRDNALDYTLDNGASNQVDRYSLFIKPQKLPINEIFITYPEGFEGQFDPKSMAVEVGGRPVPLESSKWNPGNRTVELVLKEAIPVDRTATVVLSNVRNPFFGGLFQFDARIRSITDLPVLRYVGSWMIGID